MTEDETPETHLPEPREDEMPEQFKQIRASLHAEAERVMALAQDWRPTIFRDIRDSRSPQLLGETLLRMPLSLGSLSERQDLMEAVSR